MDANYPAPKTDNGLFCAGGKLACPPEDVGGIPGFYNFCEIMKNPDHPEHKDYLEWYGQEFDPNHFSVAEANELLQEFEKET